MGTNDESFYTVNLIDGLNGANGSRRFSLKKLSDEYYEQLLDATDKYLNMYGGLLTEKCFENFKLSDSRFDNLVFDDLLSLVKRTEEYGIILEKNPVGRLSYNPGGNAGQRKRNEIRKITNRALIRRLSQEMAYSDLPLMPTNTYNSYVDTERFNNKNYEFLFQLGYRGEDDELIPPIVTGNFRLYEENEILKDEVVKLLEANCRMDYYLRKYKENPRLYRSKEALSIVFDERPIVSIRKELGLPESPKNNLVREKGKVLEKIEYTRYQKSSRANFDVKNDVKTISHDLQDGVVPTTEEQYKKLENLGYASNRRDGLPIINSGFKLYTDVNAWRDVKRRVLRSCLSLYSEINKIDSAREFLWNGEKQREPNPVLEVYNEVIKKPLVKRKASKGQATKEEVDDVIKAISAEKLTHKLRLPSSLIRNVRDDVVIER